MSRRSWRATGIFLLPTRADTYALAAAEAKTYGLRGVISDLEPLRRVVPEQEVGFVPARTRPLWIAGLKY